MVPAFLGQMHSLIFILSLHPEKWQLEGGGRWGGSPLFSNNCISFVSAFTSNNIGHSGLFVKWLLYAVAHTGETNSDLEETIGKYIIAHLELHRKTAVHNAPDVPQFAPWISSKLEC